MGWFTDDQPTPHGPTLRQMLADIEGCGPEWRLLARILREMAEQLGMGLDVPTDAEGRE